MDVRPVSGGCEVGVWWRGGVLTGPRCVGLAWFT